MKWFGWLEKIDVGASEWNENEREIKSRMNDCRKANKPIIRNKPN